MVVHLLVLKFSKHLPVNAVAVVELDEVPDDPLDGQLKIPNVSLVTSQNTAQKFRVTFNGRS